MLFIYVECVLPISAILLLLLNISVANLPSFKEQFWSYASVCLWDLLFSWKTTLPIQTELLSTEQSFCALLTWKVPLPIHVKLVTGILMKLYRAVKWSVKLDSIFWACNLEIICELLLATLYESLCCELRLLRHVCLNSPVGVVLQ